MYESVGNLFYYSHSNLEELRSTLDDFDHLMFSVEFLNEFHEKKRTDIKTDRKKQLMAFRPT